MKHTESSNEGGQKTAAVDGQDAELANVHEGLGSDLDPSKRLLAPRPNYDAQPLSFLVTHGIHTVCLRWQLNSKSFTCIDIESAQISECDRGTLASPRRYRPFYLSESDDDENVKTVCESAEICILARSYF